MILVDRQEEAPRISLVVPVYNEQESIGVFIDAVAPHLDFTSDEVLFVDDGSTDGTLKVLVDTCRVNPSVKVVGLTRNFGKEAALSAGLNYANGDVVIPMDVDLQDPPELIPEFVKRWREGYDIVYGVRSKRDGDSMYKKGTAGLFYKVFNRLSRLRIPENAGDFRLLDKRVVTELRQFSERARFMKGLYSWVGFRSIGVPYERPGRVTGETKWNYWRLWNFALDGLFSFSTVPLRIWTYMGGIVALSAFTYATLLVLDVLVSGVDVPGYASLMTVVLFLGGVQLMSLGILGEYLGRIFSEVTGRPLYVVDRVYGAPDHSKGEDTPEGVVLRGS